MQVSEAEPYEENARVTSFILSHLQQMSDNATAPALTYGLLAQRATSLANELKQMVYERLSPFIDPAPECSRIYTSQAWLDLLHEDEVLPWLHELDLAECRKADKTKHKGQPVVRD